MGRWAALRVGIPRGSQSSHPGPAPCLGGCHPYLPLPEYCSGAFLGALQLTDERPRLEMLPRLPPGFGDLPLATRHQTAPSRENLSPTKGRRRSQPWRSPMPKEATEAVAGAEEGSSGWSHSAHKKAEARHPAHFLSPPKVPAPYTHGVLLSSHSSPAQRGLVQPHCTDRESEAQKGDGNCPELHSQEGPGQGSAPGS